MTRIAWLSVAIAALFVAFVTLAPNIADKPRVYQSQTASAANEINRTPDPLEQFRLDRAESRKKQLSELKAIMSDAEVHEEIRLDAGKMRLRLLNFMEAESTVEGVLRTRGFQDAICTVHDDSVNVIVRGKSLTKSQSAIIMELAVRETGLEADDIKIIPVDG